MFPLLGAEHIGWFEIIVPEFVEEKKQTELIQESQLNSIYNDKKTEESNKYMTTGKKQMNKKQLKKLKKFQSQNEIPGEEIPKTSPLEMKCKENEKETEACKNSANSLLDDIKQEDSNEKKDSDKEFEMTQEQKEENDAKRPLMQLQWRRGGGARGKFLESIYGQCEECVPNFK